MKTWFLPGTKRAYIRVWALFGPLLAPSGSLGQVSNRQAEPLLRRKDDLHVVCWNVQTLQKRAGGQLKTWALTIKADLEPISGHAQWRKDWVKVFSELAQDREDSSASVRDVSKGRSADQTPIPCVPVASPGFKPKGRVCTNSGALKPDKLKLA